MSNMTLNYSTETNDQFKIYRLLWTMPNFTDLFIDKFTREFQTDKLYGTDRKLEYKFQLKIQFIGQNKDVVEIYYLSRNPLFLKVNLSLILIHYEERSVFVREYHTVQANKWQYLLSLFKRDITKDFASYLARDRSLNLKFQFVVADIKVDNFNVPETQLCNDFENLLNVGLFSDVTIKSVDGNNFKVHKAVLASRSAVMKAHFEHNTLECQTNIVESNLESEVLNEVLKFIYTGKASRVDEIPEQLLAAADYYQLSRLKSLCEEALHKKLTIENCLQTLQFAELHCAKQLKQLTLEFIKDGRAMLITKTESWAQVKSVELIKTIYKYIVTDENDADDNDADDNDADDNDTDDNDANKGDIK